VPSIEDVTHIEAQPKSAAQAEEEEVLHASIKAGSVAQIVVAIVAVLGLAYLLRVVMVTTLGAVLLAFIVDPLVSWLERMKVPRAAGALLGVMLLTVLSSGLTYFFYSRAVDFATELPKYSSKIRETIGRVRSQTSKIAQSTRSLVGPADRVRYGHWTARADHECFLSQSSGKAITLNPLAVALALLFWAWIWGTMGLLLAVPLVGAAKIACDHIDLLRGFGAWLGE